MFADDPGNPAKVSSHIKPQTACPALQADSALPGNAQAANTSSPGTHLLLLPLIICRGVRFAVFEIWLELVILVYFKLHQYYRPPGIDRYGSLSSGANFWQWNVTWLTVNVKFRDLNMTLQHLSCEWLTFREQLQIRQMMLVMRAMRAVIGLCSSLQWLQAAQMQLLRVQSRWSGQAGNVASKKARAPPICLAWMVQIHAALASPSHPLTPATPSSGLQRQC